MTAFSASVVGRSVLGLLARTRSRGLVGERESDVDAAGTGPGSFAAAGGNHDKLAAVHFIASRSCVSREGKRGFPEELAGGFVVGAKFFIEVRRSDEEQSTRGDDRTAIVFRSSIGLALSRQFRILAERDLPNVFSGI